MLQHTSSMPSFCVAEPNSVSTVKMLALVLR